MLEAVVALEVGQGVGLDVVGDNQADLGILEVRAVIDDVIFVLAPVIAMGYRQPGRHHRVELAGRHPLPHDPGGHGLQFDVVAELLPDHFGGHVGGRHTVGPTIDVADAYFLGHRLRSADGHCQGGAHPQESSHFHQSFPSSRHGTCIINR
ncbi:hypothetical protein D3C72_1864650 [compost metagenome]